MQSRVVSPLCQTFSAALVHSDSQALRAVENGEAIKAVLVPLELRHRSQYLVGRKLAIAPKALEVGEGERARPRHVLEAFWERLPVVMTSQPLIHGGDTIKNLKCSSLLALSTHKNVKCYPTMTKGPVSSLTPKSHLAAMQRG